ncbi:hypothetical protein EDC01DRAFT_522345 [Geopyxis carbonaria]|nr:hypothetical protein EDC01DRAFT_522345 [Geopyxis carbonaria]
MNTLTRQQKADAVRQVKETLSQVRTDWRYKPPRPRPKPRTRRATTAPPTRQASTASTTSTYSSSTISRTLSLRSGGLGSWRASEPTAADELAALTLPSRTTTPAPSYPASDSEPYDAWATSASDSSRSSSPVPSLDSDSDTSLDTPPRRLSKTTSYRRRADSPSPPPASNPLRAATRRRHALRRREGTWVQRIPDSPPSTPPIPAWDTPASVATPAERRRATRRADRALAAENPGFRNWARQRDQWTGADAAGWVRVGTSRFADNPLRRLISDGKREVYDRCVVRGNELPVPVGLGQMLEILVEGWKRDETWPSSAPQAPVQRVQVTGGRREGGESAGGLGRVKRYFGMGVRSGGGGGGSGLA